MGIAGEAVLWAGVDAEALSCTAMRIAWCSGWSTRARIDVRSAVTPSSSRQCTLKTHRNGSPCGYYSRLRGDSSLHESSPSWRASSSQFCFGWLQRPWQRACFIAPGCIDRTFFCIPDSTHTVNHQVRTTGGLDGQTAGRRTRLGPCDRGCDRRVIFIVAIVHRLHAGSVGNHGDGRGRRCRWQ